VIAAFSFTGNNRSVLLDILTSRKFPWINYHILAEPYDKLHRE